MRTAFNIFIKDVRRWWPYIILLDLFFILRAILDILIPLYPELIRLDLKFGIIGYLIGLAFCLIIVLTIQSDHLIGDRQFWGTRPISWKSLLAGKTLFILCLVNLPLFFAQSAALIANNMSLARHALILVQNQLLIGICMIFIAAIASVTRNLAHFFLFVLSLFASILAIGFLYSEFGRSIQLPESASWGSADIFKPLVQYTPMLLISSILIWIQYSKKIISKLIALLCFLIFIPMLWFTQTNLIILWHPIAQWRAWSANVLRAQSPVSFTVIGEEGKCSHQIIRVRVAGIPENDRVLIEKVKYINPKSSDDSGWSTNLQIKDHSDRILFNGDYSMTTPYDSVFFGNPQNSNAPIRIILACRLLGDPIRTTIAPGPMSTMFDQDMRCGVISWNSYPTGICVATGLQKAFLADQGYKISSGFLGFNSSIWNIVTGDSVEVIFLKNSTMLATPETAWFTATLDLPNLQSNDCHE